MNPRPAHRRRRPLPRQPRASRPPPPSSASLLAGATLGLLKLALNNPLVSLLADMLTVARVRRAAAALAARAGRRPRRRARALRARRPPPLRPRTRRHRRRPRPAPRRRPRAAAHLRPRRARPQRLRHRRRPLPQPRPHRRPAPGRRASRTSSRTSASTAASPSPCAASCSPSAAHPASSPAASPAASSQPAWLAWWRQREYRADAHAARLGFGDQLADLLERTQLLDTAAPFMRDRTHPYSELRIERLRAPEACRRGSRAGRRAHRSRPEELAWRMVRSEQAEVRRAPRPRRRRGDRRARPRAARGPRGATARALCRRRHARAERSASTGHGSTPTRASCGRSGSAAARGRLRFDLRIVERVLLAETATAAPATNGRARRSIRGNGELLPINP